jgi:4-amino-4-deoxy-L-arabinose transferase-like glycosyltransferase
VTYQKKIFWLIALSSLIRLFIAGTIELGNDEVYYWTYALHLQYNYFDHPAGVALLIRFSTLNLLLHSEIFVRLGAIISAAICTLLIFKIGTFINNKRTGWFAALLYTSSIYCSIIAGTFILPDSPQMIFWLWAILLFFKINNAYVKNRAETKYWLLFGLVSGLCIMCKVHGIFLWAAVGLYVLMFNRKWLQKRDLYLAIIISLIVISPIIIWNVQNNFITYTFHSERVKLDGGGFNTTSFLREIFGSLFYNNPINVILIWISIFGVRKYNYNKTKFRILLLFGLPLILLLIIISLFRDTLPHWSGPGYTALILIAAIYLDSKFSPNSIKIPNIIKLALTLTAIVIIAGIAAIKFYPGTLSNATKNHLGNGDFTLDMYGWHKVGIKMDAIYKDDIKNNLMPATAPIIITKWFPAAHIDYYIASVTHQNTFALGSIFNLHNYIWTNKYKPQLTPNDDAYFIMPSTNYNESDITIFKQMFDSVSLPVIIPLFRSNMLCKQIFVYRLKGYKGN